MLTASVTPYWRTHYTFGHESRESAKTLSRQSVDLLIINTVVPFLYALSRTDFGQAFSTRIARKGYRKLR